MTMKIRFRDLERRLASLIMGATGRTVEYSFAIRHLGNVKNVLDIGCSDSSLAFVLARKGFCLHGVDVRKYPFKQKALNFTLADVRHLPFMDDSFDAVLCISTIEHIGTGEYGAPIDEHGDASTMLEMTRVCKKGGKIMLTTSWSEKYRNIKGYERYYDDSHINKLIKGFRIEVEEYYAPTRVGIGYTFNWRKVSKETTRKAFLLGSRPIICLLLHKI